jgi:thiosulfate/3-mercaptopyruvate sulfurtransferase
VAPLRSPRPWPAPPGHADELAAHIDAGGVALDARSAERFRARTRSSTRRPAHSGRQERPWTAALDGRGRFRSASDLRDHFGALGAGPDAAVVCYCGSGVSACADILAAEAAGLPRPRLFVASWSGWSADPDRPVAVGHAEPS